MRIIKLKTLLKEALKDQHRILKEWTSGVFENFSIDLDDLVVPGLTQDTDVITVEINISYESDPGFPSTGMWGPPENSEQGEGPSIDINDWEIIMITIQPEVGEPRQIEDFKTLSPEHWNIIKNAVSSYMSKNERRIEDRIMDSISN